MTVSCAMARCSNILYFRKLLLSDKELTKPQREAIEKFLEDYENIIGEWEVKRNGKG